MAVGQEGEGVNLRITPINLDEANAFVAAHHRHHKPVPGAKFSIAVSDGEAVRGVAIVGRPVSRHLDDGWTLEVNRCCTDGARNACSMLYGSAWKAARALGFQRIVTYTLPEEGGASLRATGWAPTDGVGGTPWSNSTRKRSENKHSDDKPKTRWEASTHDGFSSTPRPRIEVAGIVGGQSPLWSAVI